MEEYSQEQLIQSDKEYVIISKNTKEILDDINFDNDEDRNICNVIINNLEKTASSTIRNMQVAQLPYIGCLRIDPVKRKLRDSYEAFKIARKNMTKEEYKDHVRSCYIDLTKEQDKKDKLKLYFTYIRRNNKKRYEKLFRLLGKAYAEMFIYSISLLKEIPFNQEFEDVYNSFKD